MSELKISLTLLYSSYILMKDINNSEGHCMYNFSTAIHQKASIYTDQKIKYFVKTCYSIY